MPPASVLILPAALLVFWLLFTATREYLRARPYVRAATQPAHGRASPRRVRGMFGMTAGTVSGGPSGGSSGDDHPDPGDDEYERLFEFRERRFLAIGFNHFQAVALAVAQADWHEAESLVKDGCPLDVAIDILL